MSIEQAAKRLGDLAEIIREVTAEDMSETPLIPIHRDDAETLKAAAVVLECFRLAGGVFQEERAEA